MYLSPPVSPLLHRLAIDDRSRCPPRIHAQRPTIDSIDTAWPPVVASCAAATFSAALQRAALPALAVVLLEELSLGMDTMGTLQAAILGGYVLGQVPSGALADRWGGLPVLTTGVALWSTATTAIALTAGWGPAALPALVTLRSLVGLAQSCMMPAVAAAVSHAVPSDLRAGNLGIIYACFSLGTVVGLGMSPPLAGHVGWQGVFACFGALGLFVAVRLTAALVHNDVALQAASWWVGGHLHPASKAPPSAYSMAQTLHWARSPAVAPSLAAFLWIHGVIGAC